MRSTNLLTYFQKLMTTYDSCGVWTASGSQKTPQRVVIHCSKW